MWVLNVMKEVGCFYKIKKTYNFIFVLFCTQITIVYFACLNETNKVSYCTYLQSMIVKFGECVHQRMILATLYYFIIISLKWNAILTTIIHVQFLTFGIAWRIIYMDLNVWIQKSLYLEGSYPMREQNYVFRSKNRCVRWML